MTLSLEGKAWLIKVKIITDEVNLATPHVTQRARLFCKSSNIRVKVRVNGLQDVTGQLELELF